MGIENNPSRTRNNSSNSSGKNKEQSKFVHVATGTRHSIGVDSQGVAHSWGKSHSLGQLGRSISLQFPAKTPGPITGLPRKIRNAYASHGSDSDSGHSALLDDAGMLWMTGCDRWQQLGLGSSKGGSTGYTWKGGKLWQEKFVLSRHVTDLMKEQKQKLTSETDGIRDVALGEDHTLVLGSHGTVYAFGKGGDGQLGLSSLPSVPSRLVRRLWIPKVLS
jgi:alpha-tubulin suppressor-like RCC1 family protein